MNVDELLVNDAWYDDLTLDDLEVEETVKVVNVVEKLCHAVTRIKDRAPKNVLYAKISVVFVSH